MGRMEEERFQLMWGRALQQEPHSACETKVTGRQRDQGLTWRSLARTRTHLTNDQHNHELAYLASKERQIGD